MSTNNNNTSSNTSDNPSSAPSRTPSLRPTEATTDSPVVQEGGSNAPTASPYVGTENGTSELSYSSYPTASPTASPTLNGTESFFSVNTSSAGAIAGAAFATLFCCGFFGFLYRRKCCRRSTTNKRMKRVQSNMSLGSMYSERKDDDDAVPNTTFNRILALFRFNKPLSEKKKSNALSISTTDGEFIHTENRRTSTFSYKSQDDREADSSENRLPIIDLTREQHFPTSGKWKSEEQLAAEEKKAEDEKAQLSTIQSFRQYSYRLLNKFMASTKVEDKMGADRESNATVIYTDPRTSKFESQAPLVIHVSDTDDRESGDTVISLTSALKDRKASSETSQSSSKRSIQFKEETEIVTYTHPDDDVL
jgi:hypothetical protein